MEQRICGTAAVLKKMSFLLSVYLVSNYLVDFRSTAQLLVQQEVMDPNDPNWKGKGIAQCSSPPIKRHRPSIPGQPGVAFDVLQRRAAGQGDLSISTQQAIHQALHGPPSHDFITNSAWLTAVQEGYLDRDGYTTLDTVKQVRRWGRFKLLVALVTKITPGLGDFILTLKDPTSTIEASLHHKAHEEGDFAGKIKPGVCLILQEIVAWCPFSMAYLNITVRNLERVIEDVAGLDDIVV